MSSATSEYRGKSAEQGGYPDTDARTERKAKNISGYLQAYRRAGAGQQCFKHLCSALTTSKRLVRRELTTMPSSFVPTARTASSTLGTTPAFLVRFLSLMSSLESLSEALSGAAAASAGASAVAVLSATSAARTLKQRELPVPRDRPKRWRLLVDQTAPDGATVLKCLQKR